jgi:shikimate kinase
VATTRDERPIFLVGFMGSGKTTLATALATALGWERIDTDEEVERHEGRSVERVIQESGELLFRQAERRALAATDGRRRVVVATGGGLFPAFEPRRWMKQRGRTVWLDVPLEECARRVAGGAGRPLWTAGLDPLLFRAFYERRRAAYALADLRLEPGTGGVAGDVRRLLAVFP